MHNRGSGNSDIKIDESKHRPVPTIGQKFKNSIIAVGFGAILVQMYFFYGAAKSGSFVPVSIVIFYDNYLFWVIWQFVEYWAGSLEKSSLIG